MTDFETLEKILKETLEERIISILSKKTGRTMREAMAIYYKSKLAMHIDSGKYGIHYLDAEYLVQDLLENEPALFQSENPITKTS